MGSATRTVVFTDLANYTAAVSRADRAALRDLIARHEMFIAPIVEKHGGRVVKNLGDSFMILFDAATDALKAGLEIIETAVDRDLTFRASAATGDVEEIDGDAFGDTVNLSARINSEAPAGELWFNESTRMCMKQAEIPWEEIGRFSLKGIAGETSCYRAVPRHLCMIPLPMKQAIRVGMLFRIKRGDPIPPLRNNSHVLLEGFEIGSPAMRQVLDSMPVLDPARIWLSTYNIDPMARYDWSTAGRQIIVSTPAALEEAIERVRQPTSQPAGSNTIILDTQVSEIDLVLGGLALPAVPLSDVVAAYSYDLLPDGRWVNRHPRAVIRVHVDPEAIRVTALAAGVTLSGRSLSPSITTQLSDGAVLQTPAGEVVFHRFTGGPYAGLMLSDSPLRLGVGLGQIAEIGREPQHPGLALPDRSGQDNIQWCTGSRAARARENGFTLDRALAGRRQAALEVGPGGTYVVHERHKRLATYVHRMADLGLQRVNKATAVEEGDLLITGTSVIALRPAE